MVVLKVCSSPLLVLVSVHMYPSSFVIVHTSVAPLGTVVLTFTVAEESDTVEVMWKPSYPYFIAGRYGLVNNLTLPSVALKLKSPEQGASSFLVVLHSATLILFKPRWTYPLMSKKNAL